MRCPGAVWLSTKAPAQEPSEHAAEGTAAHEVAEHCLKHAADPLDYVGQTVAGVEWTRERAMLLRTYTDWARREMRGATEALVEHRVGIPNLHEDLWGTADLIIRKPGELLVADLKFGMRQVPSAANPQLLIYMLGAMHALRVGKEERRTMRLRTAIVQPKVDPPVNEVCVSWRELRAFALELQMAVQQAERHPRTYRPGSWCKWCPAALICPALKREAGALVPSEGAAPLAPEELTNEQLVRILSISSAVRNYLERARRFAIQQLEAGTLIEGLELRDGRAVRHWTDPAEALRVLVNEYGCDPNDLLRIASPSAVEALIGRAAMEELEERGLVGRTRQSPTLAVQAEVAKSARDV